MKKVALILYVLVVTSCKGCSDQNSQRSNLGFYNQFLDAALRLVSANGSDAVDVKPQVIAEAYPSKDVLLSEGKLQNLRFRRQYMSWANIRLANLEYQIRTRYASSHNGKGQYVHSVSFIPNQFEMMEFPLILKPLFRVESTSAAPYLIESNSSGDILGVDVSFSFLFRTSLKTIVETKGCRASGRDGFSCDRLDETIRVEHPIEGTWSSGSIEHPLANGQIIKEFTLQFNHDDTVEILALYKRKGPYDRCDASSLRHLRASNATGFLKGTFESKPYKDVEIVLDCDNPAMNTHAKQPDLTGVNFQFEVSSDGKSLILSDTDGSLKGIVFTKDQISNPAVMAFRRHRERVFTE